MTTTALTSLRTTVKAHIVERLQAQPALAGIPVSGGFPGRNLQREHVWIAATRGTVTYPLMMADRKIRDDLFTITVIFQSGLPGTTTDEADARVEAMYAALEDIFADDPGLDSLNEAGIISATLGETVEGPDAELTDEGAVSFIGADVEVHARMH